MWWTESEPQALDKLRSANDEQPPWLLQDWHDLELDGTAQESIDSFMLRTLAADSVPGIESLAMQAAVNVAGLQNLCEPACLCGNFEDTNFEDTQDSFEYCVEATSSAEVSADLPIGYIVAHDSTSQSAGLNGWRCPDCRELEQVFRQRSQEQAAEHQRRLDELSENLKREGDQLRILREQAEQQREVLQRVRSELCREQVQRTSAGNAFHSLRWQKERDEANFIRQLREIESKNTSLQEENLKLQDTLQVHTEATAALHEQTQQDRLSQEAAHKEQIDRLSGELREERSRRSVAEAKVLAITTELQKSRQQTARTVKRLRGESARLKRENFRAEKEHQRTSEMHLRNAEQSYQQLADYRSRVQRLGSQLVDAQKIIQSKTQALANALTETQGLKHRLEQQSCKNVNMRLQFDDERARAKRLQFELETCEAKVVASSASLLALRHSLRQRKWQVRQIARVLQARDQQVCELQQSLDGAKSQLDLQRTALGRLLSSIWQLSSQQEVDVERMRTALDRSEREVQHYRLALESDRLRFEETKIEQRRLHDLVRERTEEIREQRDVSSILEAELAQSRQQLDHMQVSVTSSQVEKQRLENQLASTRQELQRLTQDAAQREQQAAATAEQFKSEREFHGGLLQKAREQTAELKKDLQTLRQALASARSDREAEQAAIRRQLAEHSSQTSEIAAQKTLVEQSLAEFQLAAERRQQVLHLKYEQQKLVSRKLRRRCIRSEADRCFLERQLSGMRVELLQAEERSMRLKGELRAADQGMQEMQLLTQDVVQRLEYERFSNGESRQSALDLARQLNSSRALQHQATAQLQLAAAELESAKVELQNANAMNTQLHEQCQELRRQTEMQQSSLNRRIAMLTLEAFRRCQQRWQLTKDIHKLEEDLTESRRTQAGVIDSEKDLRQACRQLELQLERLHAMLRSESAGRRKAEIALERAAEKLDETSHAYVAKQQMDLERRITRARNELAATQGLLKKERNRLGNLRIENDLLRQEVQGLRYRQAG